MHRTHHLPRELPGSLHEIAGEFELLAAHAVRAFIRGGVHVSVLAHLLPELLHALHMPVLGGADEIVVDRVHGFQHRQPGLGHQPVHPLLRGHATCFGRALHLRAVLVHPGQVPNLLPALAVPTGEHIARSGRVRVPDVRRIVDVIDRRGDVVRLLTRQRFTRRIGHAPILGVDDGA